MKEQLKEMGGGAMILAIIVIIVSFLFFAVDIARIHFTDHSELLGKNSPQGAYFTLITFEKFYDFPLFRVPTRFYISSKVDKIDEKNFELALDIIICNYSAKRAARIMRICYSSKLYYAATDALNNDDHVQSSKEVVEFIGNYGPDFLRKSAFNWVYFQGA